MQSIRSTGARFLTCALAFAAPAANAAPHVYYFSPVNQHSVQVSAGYWNPIIRYVSARSGVVLNLKLGRTSSDTTSYVLTHEVDFAFTDHLFSQERGKLGWTVFGRRNAAPLRAQIVAPSDATVARLADLSQAAVGFTGPQGVLSYKIPYAQLLGAGIPVTVAFSGNMDAAFAQLFSGKIKAVGANSQLVQNYARRTGKAFKVLWSSAPFNDLALMASPRVPERDVRAVADAFLGMHRDAQGKKILATAAALVHAAEPLSFVAASDADYASYRDFYAGAPASLR
jgi:phosphonate transport system substrate-binding protein